MKRRSLWQVFALPLVLGLASLGGLVWALLVEGHQDVFAALATGSGLAVIGWVLLRSRR